MFNYLKILIILLITNECFSFSALNKGNNYVIVANEDSFFQPCAATDNSGSVYMDDLLEFHLRHEYAEDMETLITNGNITIKFDVSDDVKLVLDLEVYEWKRGKWEKTIFSIRRDDFCKSAFDPREFWYPLTIQVPKEDRVCPPPKGFTYHLVNVENNIELKNIFGLDLEGQYKLIAHFIVDTFSTCITAIVNIWKN